MKRITTYIVIRGEAKEYPITGSEDIMSKVENDPTEYKSLTKGYKKLASFGTDRQACYDTYLASKDKLTVLILGSHSDMFNGTAQFYK